MNDIGSNLVNVVLTNLVFVLFLTLPIALLGWGHLLIYLGWPVDAPRQPRWLQLVIAERSWFRRLDPMRQDTAGDALGYAICVSVDLLSVAFVVLAPFGWFHNPSPPLWAGAGAWSIHLAALLVQAALVIPIWRQLASSRSGRI